MKRFSILLGLILAALTLLAAGTPAQAGERPIHAAGRGILLDSGYSAQLVGPGRGEHLGPCRLDIYLNYYELYHGIYANVAPTALMLEAANGDRLFAWVDSDFDPATGIVAGTITFFTGTGRFADATGSARLRIVPDTDWFEYSSGYPYPIGETRFSWALEGTIDY